MIFAAPSTLPDWASCCLGVTWQLLFTPCHSLPSALWTLAELVSLPCLASWCWSSCRSLGSCQLSQAVTGLVWGQQQ